MVVSISGGVAMADPGELARQRARPTPLASDPAAALPERAASDPQPLPGPERDGTVRAARRRRGEAARGARRHRRGRRRTHRSPRAELVDELQSDPLMFVTSEGMVGYTEPVAAVEPADAAAPPTGRSRSPSTCSRSTRARRAPGWCTSTSPGTPPSATTGTSTTASPRSCRRPYDIDGNTSAFSDTEQQRIYDIWKVVADDYAPFDVDVTTQDPGVDGLRKTSAGDGAYGKRIVITSSDWYYAGPRLDHRRHRADRRVQLERRPLRVRVLGQPRGRLGEGGQRGHVARGRPHVRSVPRRRLGRRRRTTSVTATGHRSWASATTRRSRSGRRASTPARTTPRTISR